LEKGKILKDIFIPKRRHQIDAGPKVNVSDIAIPPHGIRKTVETIAIQAQIRASLPIFFSYGVFSTVKPITRRERARSRKKLADIIT
jgi:hypothetical protein